jgi:hypothetical protein
VKFVVKEVKYLFFLKRTPVGVASGRKRLPWVTLGIGIGEGRLEGQYNKKLTTIYRYSVA